MNQIVPFKTRVKNEAIKYASTYEKVMNNKEYLIYSNSFSVKNYYILKAYKTNYLHLIGVHTTLSPLDFYEKCLNGTLTENDFDFSFKNKKESETKGSVRRKIKSLIYLEHFFENVIKIEEKFSKGNISCALADTDGNITLGYAKAENCVPMTLLSGNELSNKAVSCDLLLSRNKGDNEFNDILIGNQKDLDSFLKNNSDIRYIGITIEEIPVERIDEFWDIQIKYLLNDKIIDTQDKSYYESSEYRDVLKSHMLRTPDTLHMIYFVRNGIRIGACQYCTFKSEDGKCFILDFWVFKEFRGNNTGHDCFEALNEYTKSDGALYYSLNYAKEESRRFWLSLGFEDDGIDEYGSPLMIKRKA